MNSEMPSERKSTGTPSSAPPLRPFSFDGPPAEQPVWPWNLWRFANAQQLTTHSTPDAAKTCHDIGIVCILALHNAARLGSPHAAFFLQNLLRMGCDALGVVEKAVPDFVKPIAACANDWPILAGPSNPQLGEVEQRLRGLGVGTQAPSRVTQIGKLPDFNHEPYPTLAKLEDYVMYVRGRHQLYGKVVLSESDPAWAKQAGELDALSLDSVNAWFEVMWDVLRSATGDKPESCPELMRLGKARALDNQKYGAHNNPSYGTQMASVRNGIKQRMRRDYMNLLKIRHPHTSAPSVKGSAT